MNPASPNRPSTRRPLDTTRTRPANLSVQSRAAAVARPERFAPNATPSSAKSASALPALEPQGELSFWPAGGPRARSTWRPRRFECSEAAPDPKLLRTLLEQWSVSFADGTVNVHIALSRLSAALLATDDVFGLEIWGGGSMVPYVLQYTYQPEQPNDIDPLVYLERAPGLSLAALGELVAEAWRDLGGSTQAHFRPGVTHLKFLIRGDATGDGVLQARLTTGPQHIDLRFAFTDAHSKPYDFRCNGVVCGLGDDAPFSTLPGLDAGQVMQDIRNGVYVLDHRLYGADIGRLWHIRSRGFVPARLNDEQEVNDAFDAWIDEHPDAEILGPDLSVRHLLERVLSGRSRPRKQILFLNAMLAIHQRNQGKQQHVILRSLATFAPTLRPSLEENCPTTAVLCDLLATRQGASQLALWVALVADEVCGMPRLQEKIKSVRIALGPTKDARMARIFLPELRGFVVARAGDLSDLKSLPESLPMWQASFFAAPLHEQLAEVLGAPSLALLWPDHLTVDEGVRSQVATQMAAWIAQASSPLVARRLSEGLLMLSPEAPNDLGLSLGDDATGALKVAQARWLSVKKDETLAHFSDPLQSVKTFLQACATLGHPSIWQAEAEKMCALQACILDTLCRMFDRQPYLAHGPAAPIRELIDQINSVDAPPTYFLTIAKIWAVNFSSNETASDADWLAQKADALREAYRASSLLASHALAWGGAHPEHMEGLLLLVQDDLDQRPTSALAQYFIAIDQNQSRSLSHAQEVLLSHLATRNFVTPVERERGKQVWDSIFRCCTPDKPFRQSLEIWSSLSHERTSTESFELAGLEALLPVFCASTTRDVGDTSSRPLTLPDAAHRAFSLLFAQKRWPEAALATIATLLCGRPIDALYRFDEEAITVFRDMPVATRVLLLKWFIAAFERLPDAFGLDEADLLFRLYWSASESKAYDGPRWEHLGGRLLNLCIVARQYARGINLLFHLSQLPQAGRAHVASAIALFAAPPHRSRETYGGNFLEFATLAFTCDVRSELAVPLSDFSLQLLLENKNSEFKNVAYSPKWLSFLFYRATARPVMPTDSTGRLLDRLFRTFSEQEGLAFAEHFRALSPSIATTSILNIFVRSGSTVRTRHAYALRSLTYLGLYEEHEQGQMAFDRDGFGAPDIVRAGADCIAVLLPSIVNNQGDDPERSLEMWLACVAALCGNDVRLLWIDALEKERPTKARPEALFCYLLTRIKLLRTVDEQKDLALCSIGVLHTLLHGGRREAALDGFIELNKIFTLTRPELLRQFLPLLEGFYEAARTLGHLALRDLTIIRGLGLAVISYPMMSPETHLSLEDSIFQLTFRGINEFNLVIIAWLLRRQSSHDAVFSLDDPFARAIAKSLHAVPRDQWLDTMPLPVSCERWTYLRGVTLLRTLARRPPTPAQILAVARALPATSRRDPEQVRWVTLIRAILQRIEVHSDFIFPEFVKNELRDLRLQANPRLRMWLGRLEEAVSDPSDRRKEETEK